MNYTITILDMKGYTKSYIVMTGSISSLLIRVAELVSQHQYVNEVKISRTETVIL